MNMEKQDKVTKVLRNPYLQISVGVIVIATLLLDQTFFSHHHGMFVLALWHILHGLPNIVDALQRIWKYNKKRKRRK